MTYWLTCPVCRVAHAKEYGFLSSPRSLESLDGRVLPAESCGIHSAGELRAAWPIANPLPERVA